MQIKCKNFRQDESPTIGGRKDYPQGFDHTTKLTQMFNTHDKMKKKTENANLGTPVAELRGLEVVIFHIDTTEVTLGALGCFDLTTTIQTQMFSTAKRKNGRPHNIRNDIWC